MTESSAPLLLRSVDRAAFAVALGDRLRGAGVPVALPALATFSDALGALHHGDLRALYWTARVTLVHRAQDLRIFDAVFEAVFEDARLPLQGQAAGPPAGPSGPADLSAARAAGLTAPDLGTGLPWHTPREVSVAEETDSGARLRVPELLPSSLEAVAEVPFEDLDERQLELVGAWLERALSRWPSRRSRRRQPHHAGRRVDLRATVAASRRTGWEVVELRRSRTGQRPRSVTMVADVSASMQPYATAYLHLMRALSWSEQGEAFAFSTSLTRVTPALRHRSPQQAISEASELVVDRYGGTHLASSLAGLLGSRHAEALRGGVLVIASDGWDSDGPGELTDVLVRLRRRVHRLVWLNPRVAAPGFEPLVGSMAAALPFCDDLLPAHSLVAVTQAMDAILGPAP